MRDAAADFPRTVLTHKLVLIPPRQERVQPSFVRGGEEKAARAGGGRVSLHIHNRSGNQVEAALVDQAKFCRTKVLDQHLLDRGRARGPAEAASPHALACEQAGVGGVIPRTEELATLTDRLSDRLLLLQRDRPSERRTFIGALASEVAPDGDREFARATGLAVDVEGGDLVEVVELVEQVRRLQCDGPILVR